MSREWLVARNGKVLHYLHVTDGIAEHLAQGSAPAVVWTCGASARRAMRPTGSRRWLLRCKACCRVAGIPWDVGMPEREPGGDAA